MFLYLDRWIGVLRCDGFDYNFALQNGIQLMPAVLINMIREYAIGRQRIVPKYEYYQLFDHRGLLITDTAVTTLSTGQILMYRLPDLYSNNAKNSFKCHYKCKMTQWWHDQLHFHI